MAFHNVVPGNTWNYTYSDYTPFVTNITAITQSQIATVTTAETVPYTAGELVSFRVSEPYGMIQMNNRVGRVLTVSTNTFTVEIDTSGFRPFVYPPVGTVAYPAVVVPSGSGVIPAQYVPTVNLQDVFDNAPL